MTETLRPPMSWLHEDRWWEVACPCRGDGPWIVFAPTSDFYICARCEQPMNRRRL